MRIALYQPDIPQNTGTILRMAACLGVTVEIIQPTGFDMTDKALRRAGLDYLEHVTIRRHASFADFDQLRRSEQRRLILLTSHAETPLQEACFTPSDIVMLGRESAGVPAPVHDLADARIAIPMRPGLRSLNIAVAAGIALWEALRQTGGLAAAPHPGDQP